VKLRLRSIKDWETYCSDGANVGGLFVPSTTNVTPGEDIIVAVGSALLPNEVMLRGRVQSWRPALPRARVRAGAALTFGDEEQKKMEFIGDVMRGARTSIRRRKFPRLPVRIAAHYRLANCNDLVAVVVTEIAVGGALLDTATPMSLGQELVLEISSPNAAAALLVSSKVSYHGAGTSTGIQFVIRDAHGKRRISELVRRFKEA
jgi:Tfp pilus assembly protein PilZ